MPEMAVVRCCCIGASANISSIPILIYETVILLSLTQCLAGEPALVLGFMLFSKCFFLDSLSI